MDNRERFEQWVSTQSVVTKYGAKLHKGVTGRYKDLRIEQRFAAWSAALAQQVNAELAVAQQYLTLTDAMGYDSTSGLSPEEHARNLAQQASGQDREDAERWRWATSLEDNAETLHSIVLSYGGDQQKINERADVYRTNDIDAARAAAKGDV